MIGSQGMFDISKKLIKDVKDQIKPRALVLFIRGVAYNGYYHKALHYIPDYVSSSNELELYTEIIKAEVQRQLKEKKRNNPKYYNDYEKYDSPNRNNYGSGDEENAYGESYYSSEDE